MKSFIEEMPCIKKGQRFILCPGITNPAIYGCSNRDVDGQNTSLLGEEIESSKKVKGHHSAAWEHVTL